MGNIRVPLRSEVKDCTQNMSVEMGNIIRSAMTEAIAEAVNGRDCYPLLPYGQKNAAIDGQRRYYENAVSFMVGWLARFSESGKAAKGVITEATRDPWGAFQPTMHPIEGLLNGGIEAEPEAPRGSGGGEVVSEHPITEIDPRIEGAGASPAGRGDSGNPRESGGADGTGLGFSPGTDAGGESVGDICSEEGGNRPTAKRKTAKTPKRSPTKKRTKG